MKRGSVILLCLATLIAVQGWAQERRVTNIQSEILVDFDDPEAQQWIVRGSKFATEGFPRQAHVNTWPEALFRQEPEGRTLNSLGIHARFDRQGYNYVEIIPAEEGENGDLVESSIRIPGRVQQLDLWYWGSNFDYYLEIHLRDYRGIVHVLELGDLNFLGWQNLRVNIPTFIPQSVQYAPSFRGLEIVNFVIWTRPQERVNDYYAYLDQIKVTTDLFEEPFDGERLADPEYVEGLWSDATGENDTAQ
jgi:hypothetical protein